MKIFNFLSTLLSNKNYISQKSPILADFKNIIKLRNKKLDFGVMKDYYKICNPRKCFFTNTVA